MYYICFVDLFNAMKVNKEEKVRDNLVKKNNVIESENS